jgi:hypothetical protein
MTEHLSKGSFLHLNAVYLNYYLVPAIPVLIVQVPKYSLLGSKNNPSAWLLKPLFAMVLQMFFLIEVLNALILMAIRIIQSKIASLSSRSGLIPNTFCIGIHFRFTGHTKS